MHPTLRTSIAILALSGSQGLAEGARGDADDDRFLEGYVGAILEREIGIEDPIFEVRDGRVRVDLTGLSPAERDRVAAALAEVEGLDIEPADSSLNFAEGAELEEVLEMAATTGALPRKPLFDPLIADPRDPRFSASLQFYDDESELDTVGSTNFGGTLPVYGFEALGSTFQVGLQAGVFAIFDVIAESFPLINADYFVAAPLTFRNGPFSAQARLFHQSSHLGDEFLLRNRVDRIDLAYEAVDLLGSVELFEAVRLYGGGGAIVRSSPDLDAPFVQGGIELTSPDPVLGEVLFPLVAFDYQSSAELDWESDYSVRAGIDIRAGFVEQRRLLFLVEYFNGKSPNGQFFEQDLEFVGTGLHFFF